jgi:hypothetical protein
LECSIHNHVEHKQGSIDEVVGEAANLVFIGDIADSVGIRKKVPDTIPLDEEFHKAFETATVSKAQFCKALPALSRNGRQGRRVATKLLSE